MNKLYGITNDNLIVVIESICHCTNCVKRGMYEAELNLLDGSYYSTLRLDELKDFLKFVSPNYKTVSNYFKEIILEKIERYRFILMSNWRNTPTTVRHAFQDLLNENLKLEKALDKACEELNELCKQTKCKDCHFVKEQANCFNDCPVSGNLDKSIWKEWCMKDVD